MFLDLCPLGSEVTSLGARRPSEVSGGEQDYLGFVPPGSGVASVGAGRVCEVFRQEQDSPSLCPLGSGVTKVGAIFSHTSCALLEVERLVRSEASWQHIGAWLS